MIIIIIEITYGWKWFENGVFFFLCSLQRCRHLFEQWRSRFKQIRLCEWWFLLRYYHIGFVLYIGQRWWIFWFTSENTKATGILNSIHYFYSLFVYMFFLSCLCFRFNSLIHTTICIFKLSLHVNINKSSKSF